MRKGVEQRDKYGYNASTVTDRMTELSDIQKQFQTRIKEATTMDALQQLRVAVLGKKGTLTEILKTIPSLDPSERKTVGTQANQLRETFEQQITEKEEQLQDRQVAEQLQKEWRDTTLPQATTRGHIHPIMQTQRKVERIFTSMGFMIFDGPELESEFFNFDAVNTPADHPAREAQDTFWLEDGNLMRTQTTSVQVRAMREHGPVMRGIVPGKVFRNERLDDTHENTFFQIEGIMIDKHLTVAHLIATMKTLVSKVLEQDVEVRLRPGYFPFVEPGFELDAKVTFQTDRGEKTKWIELIPCGMVHPAVLREGGIDPAEYTGFAFAVGLDRLTMMQFDIANIRHFHSGNLDFLQQF